MLVITGAGRTGTSVLAAIAKDLGHDVGGKWKAHVRAGLEESRAVCLNNCLMESLKIDGPFGEPFRPVSLAMRVLPNVMPWFSVGKRAAGKLGSMEFLRRRRPRRPRWEYMETAVERFGEDLRKYAQSRAVVKDPSFLWTLPIWLRAGARIEHVIVTMRNVEMIRESRQGAGLSQGLSDAGFRESIAMGYGETWLALELTSKTTYSVLKFPDFLHDPGLMYRSLGMPLGANAEEFERGVEAVVRPELVSTR